MIVDLVLSFGRCARARRGGGFLDTILDTINNMSRIVLSGYEKAKRLQIRGMIAYAAVAVLALAVFLVLPLSMDAELRDIVWLSFAGLLFIPFIPLWILLCNHVLAPDWNTYATWYRRRDRKGLGFEDLYRAMGVTRS